MRSVSTQWRKIVARRPNRGIYSIISLTVPRKIRLGKHTVTCSLEQEFWNQIDDIAADRDMTFAALIEDVVRGEGRINGRKLASILHVYAMWYVKEKAALSPRKPASKTRGRNH